MMITRLMVALLALYIVSGGPKNWAGFAPAANAVVTGDSVAAQASLAKQALDFCLAHREICAEAAGSLMKTAAPSPASPVVAPLQAAATAEAAAHLPAPDLPLPPRRRAGT